MKKEDNTSEKNSLKGKKDLCAPIFELLYNLLAIYTETVTKLYEWKEDSLQLCTNQYFHQYAYLWFHIKC